MKTRSNRRIAGTTLAAISVSIAFAVLGRPQATFAQSPAGARFDLNQTPKAGNPGNVVFADAYPGSDAGAQIAAAIAALPATGGVVDARGLTGPRTISNNFLSGVAKPVTILFGAGIFTTANLGLSTGVARANIIGAGPGLTTFIASAANTPVFSCLANSARLACDKDVIENLSVKANASGSTGPALELTGFRFSYFSDIEYLSNGRGNFNSMFHLAAYPSLCYNNVIDRLIVEGQTGPATVVLFDEGGGGHPGDDSNVAKITNSEVYLNSGISTVFDLGESTIVTVDGGDIEANPGAVVANLGNGSVVEHLWIEANNDYRASGGASNRCLTEALSESGGTVTVTCRASVPASIKAGATVAVGGVTPAGYNGAFTVASVSGNQFTFTNAVTGLGNASVQGAASAGVVIKAASNSWIFRNNYISGGPQLETIPPGRRAFQNIDNVNQAINLIVADSSGTLNSANRDVNDWYSDYEVGGAASMVVQDFNVPGNNGGDWQWGVTNGSVYCGNAGSFFWYDKANSACRFEMMNNGAFRVLAANGTAPFSVNSTTPVPNLTAASAVNVVRFSAAPTFNAALGNVQEITLTGNVTSSMLTNAVAGEKLNFVICQDGTGSRAFRWPAQMRGAMTIGSTASKCSAQEFVYDGRNAYALSPGVKDQ